MPRRYRLALAAVVVTVALVSRLVSTADSSYEMAVLLWRVAVVVAVVVHGWFLARRQQRPGGREETSGRALKSAY